MAFKLKYSLLKWRPEVMMKKLLVILLLSLSSVSSYAFDCKELVEKVYNCGERTSYSSSEICDDGRSFEETMPSMIDDLAIDSFTSGDNILTCDFSYPASYTSRCYGSVKTDLDEELNLKLVSYQCFDLETGKKL